MNENTSMKERTIVSASTLLISLGSYFYAKAAEKDAMPYVMIGGFLGALVGELISTVITNKDDKNKKCKE
jgi:hypothetical protein